MTSLTVWKFDAAGDAESAMLVLEGLHAGGSISLHDAAAVSRFEGQHRARVTRPAKRLHERLDEQLVETTASSLGEGHSVLIGLTSDADLDEVARSFTWGRGHLVALDMDPDIREKLQKLIDG